MKLFTCQNCGQLLHFENSACMRCGMTARLHPRDSRCCPRSAKMAVCFRAMADGNAWAPLRQRLARRLQLAGARRQPRRLLPGLRSQPHDPRTSPTPATPSAGACSRRPSGGWSTRSCASACRSPSQARGPHEGPRLRLPRRLRPRRAGADRPRRRADHHQHRRGRIPPSARSRRVELGEPYRTLLGHLRHEVGHYYWDLLVRDGGRVEAGPRRLRRRDRGLPGGAAAALPRRARPATGRRTTSAPMPPCTPGRTSPRPGPTICTSSTPSTPPRTSASRSIRRSATDPNDQRRGLLSTPTAPAASTV